MDEFARAEAVNVDLRELPFEVTEQIQIPLLGQFWMMAALHQDLRAAKGQRLLDLPIDLIERDDVGVVVLLGAIKRAELAIHVADVGVIDVAVNDIGDYVIASP